MGEDPLAHIPSIGFPPSCCPPSGFPPSSMPSSPIHLSPPQSRFTPGSAQRAWHTPGHALQMLPRTRLIERILPCIAGTF